MSDAAANDERFENDDDYPGHYEPDDNYDHDLALLDPDVQAVDAAIKAALKQLPGLKDPRDGEIK